MSIMDVLLRKNLADDFITHESHRYAKQVAQDIREETDVLEQLPKIGKSTGSRCWKCPGIVFAGLCYLSAWELAEHPW